MNNFALACLGRIHAGPPTFSPPDEDLVDFAEIFCAPDRFVLRVQGDALEASGIRHGDLLVIRHSRKARDGVLILALVDGQDTELKFYRRQANRVVLYTESGQVTRYAPQRVQIQGELVAQLRLWRH